ncbi:MAG: hypothetical protein MRY63_09340 [Neomegalonema sp.]|nr:hypothetical protein [Neomegalonema sp.]
MSDELALNHLAEGAVIRAVFPRMMGKSRPGVVMLVPRSGKGGALCVVAVPMTRVRTNQPGRIAMSPERDPLAGLRCGCWVMLAGASVLPVSSIDAVTGRLAPDRFADMEQEFEAWFGANWQRTQPSLAIKPAKARLLHPKRRR